MKKSFKVFFIISVLLLFINIGYVYFHISTFNLLSFLLLVITLPSILYSLSVSYVILEIEARISKFRGIIYMLFSLIFTLFINLLLKFSSNPIEKIIENTSIANTGNLSISNVTANSGFTSYLFIFLLTFVLSILFSVVLNKVRESGGSVHK